jgi:hypothetical protein
MHSDSLLDLDKSNALSIMTWPLSTLWGQALKECVGDPAYPDAPDDYSNARFLPNSIVERYEHGLWRKKFNKIFNM